MLKKRFKFYEEDRGDNPIATVAETPAAVVHAAEGAPETTVHVAHQATEIPHAALNESISLLNSSIATLNSGINDLREDLRKSKETVEPVATEPVEASHEVAQEVAPEIVEPPKERYVRRNGRRVKR